jgi:cation:H+ antiporter
MSMLSIFYFGLGLALLVGGAELLVRGASRLAARLGIPPLIVGLTIVAMGTSAPEVAVSFQSALRDESDLALGNVVGSNIANVLLILGLSAVVAPLIVSSQLVRVDVPVMIGASALVLLLALDGRLGRSEGVALLALMGGYTAFLCVMAFRGREAPTDEPDGTARRGHPGLDVLRVACGLALLVFGADRLVAGAVAIAESLGVGKLIIGLTVVAVGTSLPELATSVVAAIRGQRDIAAGNIIGSNIFNLLFVLGLSAAGAPEGIAVASEALRFDLPVMAAVAIACLPICFTGYSIARWEGALFLAYFVAYVSYLILASTGSASAGAFGRAMLLFVMPLTGTTLAVIAARALRAGRRAALHSDGRQRGKSSD